MPDDRSSSLRCEWVAERKSVAVRCWTTVTGDEEVSLPGMLGLSAEGYGWWDGVGEGSRELGRLTSNHKVVQGIYTGHTSTAGVDEKWRNPVIKRAGTFPMIEG